MAPPAIICVCKIDLPLLFFSLLCGNDPCAILQILQLHFASGLAHNSAKVRDFILQEFLKLPVHWPLN